MFVTKLVRLYRIPVVGRLACFLVSLFGADIPRKIECEDDVEFPHNSTGTVLHPYTRIGHGVKIYQNVTVGRGDIWRTYDASSNLEFIIEDGAVLCAGAKVINSKGRLVVGRNSIIAANAVLLCSTKENEIWGGVPAKRIGVRS